uniref:Uncharacterized protein n=1 Tax=Anguilla anguilla TaxID=7936 RepID=A0A0E9QK20_ANGAN
MPTVTVVDWTGSPVVLDLYKQPLRGVILL